MRMFRPNAKTSLLLATFLFFLAAALVSLFLGGLSPSEPPSVAHDFPSKIPAEVPFSDSLDVYGTPPPRIVVSGPTGLTEDGGAIVWSAPAPGEYSIEFSVANSLGFDTATWTVTVEEKPAPKEKPKESPKPEPKQEPKQEPKDKPKAASRKTPKKVMRVASVQRSGKTADEQVNEPPASRPSQTQPPPKSAVDAELKRIESEKARLQREKNRLERERQLEKEALLRRERERENERRRRVREREELEKLQAEREAQQREREKQELLRRQQKRERSRAQAEKRRLAEEKRRLEEEKRRRQRLREMMEEKRQQEAEAQRRWEEERQRRQRERERIARLHEEQRERAKENERRRQEQAQRRLEKEQKQREERDKQRRDQQEELRKQQEKALEEQRENARSRGEERRKELQEKGRKVDFSGYEMILRNSGIDEFLRMAEALNLRVLFVSMRGRALNRDKIPYVVRGMRGGVPAATRSSLSSVQRLLQGEYNAKFVRVAELPERGSWRKYELGLQRSLGTDASYRMIALFPYEFIGALDAKARGYYQANAPNPRVPFSKGAGAIRFTITRAAAVQILEIGGAR